MKRGVWAFGLILFSTSAVAYIDPGTGSAVAGSIWPIILMILGAIGAFFAKWFIKPIKKIWNTLLQK
jgi:hypothetical protein